MGGGKTTITNNNEKITYFVTTSTESLLIGYLEELNYTSYAEQRFQNFNNLLRELCDVNLLLFRIMLFL